MSKPCVFLSAAEHSADVYAALLIRELKKRRDDLEIVGLGGPEMERAGCMLIEDMVSMSGMWFAHALQNFQHYLAIYRRAKEFLHERRPNVIVPIDSPAFNLRLARFAKRDNIPVVYYVSPQIWAWGGWRKNKIARRVDRLLTLFPFEPSLYENTGLEAQCVGHPFYDFLSEHEPNPEDVQKLRAQYGHDLVAILPGSRKREIALALPVYLAAARTVTQKFPEAKIVVSAAREDLRSFLQEVMNKSNVDFPIVGPPVFPLIDAARLCVATSGTVTLALLHFARPSVLGYRITRHEYVIMKLFKRSPFIGLPNVLAGRELLPEFLMVRDKSEEIAESVLELLRNQDKWETCREELRKLRDAVAQPGATQRAANVVLEFV